MLEFEVIIDDFFSTLVTDADLKPIRNKRVLSIVNDFEDGNWRHEKFHNFIWDNIAKTALSAQEREKLIARSRTSLKESAKKLRLTDKASDIGEGSELAEIFLYGIMHHYFNALPVVPKIFYKQNPQDNAKGADSVHIVIEDEDTFSLWFGEAKFYNSIENARLPAVIASVGNSLKSDKLKKENSIISGLKDLDLLVGNSALSERIREALSGQNSIDGLKPKLHIPILLLHECKITARSKSLSQEYVKAIRESHIDRANEYFHRQIETLSGVINLYEEIKFHLILFPVPIRSEIVKYFVSEVDHYRNGA